MSLSLFVLVWLTAYRLTRLVVKDTILDGPRKRWFKRFPPDSNYGKLYNRPVSKWGQLISCAWCSGLYMSGLVVLCVSQFEVMPLPLLWWFATSSAVGLTAKSLDA